jgi:hypothetical protein
MGVYACQSGFYCWKNIAGVVKKGGAECVMRRSLHFHIGIDVGQIPNEREWPSPGIWQ